MCITTVAAWRGVPPRRSVLAVVWYLHVRAVVRVDRVLDCSVCEAAVLLRRQDAAVDVDGRPREVGVAVARRGARVDDERRCPLGDARPLEVLLFQAVACATYARN